MKITKIFRIISESIGLLLLVIILLISPLIIGLSLAFHRMHDVDGKERIYNFYSGFISPDNVERYKFRIVGIGDTDDFWELKNYDANACQLIIEAYDFEPIQNDKLLSLMNPPRWWPELGEQYLVYEKSYDIYNGSEELWVPREGSTAYLFKFQE